MRGLPRTVLGDLRATLLSCREFRSFDLLYAVFEDDRLKLRQKGLRWAKDREELVDFTISDLVEKFRRDGQWDLVLLLEVLSDRYNDPDDHLHYQLLSLVMQLRTLGQSDGTKYAESHSPEANPAGIKMLRIHEVETMLACARSVAYIEVPKIVGNQSKGVGCGTAWLVSPDLAVTCWHVIQCRAPFEAPLLKEDLDAQIAQTLLTFDFTETSHGLQYSVTLEYPTLEELTLDYAILRVAERSDISHRQRGYLRLDADAPLTPQSSLYIIQHPLGQEQQVTGDAFVKDSTIPGRILYKTPTEPGTSGSPVFNRVNWRVVALHNGESPEKFREGIRMQAILENLKEHRPEIYDEIQEAQNI